MTTILIVEDNDMNLDMLSRRLEKKGFTIATARDGQAGVETAAALRPDLILMDMSLPVMDGWTATRTLKASADTQAIPVIALTAHAMAGDRERFLQAGLDDHLAKPVKVAEMLDAMKRALDRRAETARKKA